MNAATIYSFEERNIEIQLLLNGTMAIVTYEITMSFEYMGQEIPNWEGRDLMTLKFEDGKWMICSDLFVQYSDYTALIRSKIEKTLLGAQPLCLFRHHCLVKNFKLKE